MLPLKEDDTVENCFICQSHHFVTGKHTSVYGMHVCVCVCVCVCARARTHTHTHTLQLQEVLTINSEVADATAAINATAAKRQHILQNTSPTCFQVQK